MSFPSTTPDPTTPSPREPFSSIQSRKTPLAQLGGGLGVAACLIGMAICITLCAGFSGVLMMAIVPALLGIGGLILSIVGANAQKHLHVPDATVFAAMFVNVLGILLAAILIWVWTIQ